MSASDPKRTLANVSTPPLVAGGNSGQGGGGTIAQQNRKVSEPSHSPINEAVVDFAYEKWRRVMLVTLPPIKIQIRVRRPRKLAIKQWVSWKDR
jgi:hypothetical protein